MTHKFYVIDYDIIDQKLFLLIGELNEDDHIIIKGKFSFRNATIERIAELIKDEVGGEPVFVDSSEKMLYHELSTYGLNMQYLKKPATFCSGVETIAKFYERRGK